MGLQLNFKQMKYKRIKLKTLMEVMHSIYKNIKIATIKETIATRYKSVYTIIYFL